MIFKKLSPYFSRLGRYAKVDLNYLTSGSFWMGLNQFSSSLKSILIGVMFVNLFTQTDYGLFKFILALAALFEVFLLRDTNLAVTQAVAKGEEGSYKSIVRFKSKWSRLYTLSLFLTAAYYYFLKDDSVIVFCLLSLGFFSPFTATFSTFRPFLEGKKAFSTLAFSNISINIIEIITVLLTLWYTRSIVWVIGIRAVLNCMSHFLAYHYTLIRFRPSSGGEADAISYGKQLTAVRVVGIFAGKLDTLLLFKYWGAATLAQYAVAQILPNQGYQFLKSFIQILVPRLSETNMSSIKKQFYMRIGQSLIIGAFFVLIYWLIIPFAFKLLFPTYTGKIVFYAQILSLDILFSLPIAFIGSVFISQKLVRGIYIANIVPSFVKILLYLILGIKNGIEGMILAYLASRLFTLFFDILLWEYLLHRRSKLEPLRSQ